MFGVANLESGCWIYSFIDILVGKKPEINNTGNAVVTSRRLQLDVYREG